MFNKSLTINTALKSRIAVSYAFFVNGLVFAIWAANIPSIQTRFNLSEASLGVLLLVMGIGAVIVMPITGWFVHRFGSRRITILASIAYSCGLPFLFLVGELWHLYFMVFFYGACSGSMDVSMNDQAVIVEKIYQRSIMSSFHAQFSVGGLVGAGLSALVLFSGGTPLQLSIFMVIVLLVVTWLLFPSLSRQSAPKLKEDRAFYFHPTLLLLALLAFVVFLSEGAIADWSALYLRDTVGTDASIAALGYAVFSAAMLIGRLSGDVIIERWGHRLILTVSSVLFTVGVSIMLAVPSLSFALLGLLLSGAGLANMVPIIFTRAGNLKGLAASAGVATVSTCGYSGFLLGPPMIGALAHWSDLAAALSLLIVFGVIVMVASRRC